MTAKDYTLAENLEAQLPMLSAKDQAFARDLIKAARSARGASPKQQYWLETLHARARNPQAVTAAPAVSLGDAAEGILRLFMTARARGLKYPHIHLLSRDGTHVVFKLAGDRSRYQGQVQITDDRPYGANSYFGRIDQQGHLTAARDMTPAVRDLVDAFGADPAGVAAAYGRESGNCCFCHKGLTTDESTAVGYGPICAEKYNLPWGETVKVQAAPKVANPGGSWTDTLPPAYRLPAAPASAYNGWDTQEEMDADEGLRRPTTQEGWDKLDAEMNRIDAEGERVSEENAFMNDPDYLIDVERDDRFTGYSERTGR